MVQQLAAWRDVLLTFVDEWTIRRAERGAQSLAVLRWSLDPYGRLLVDRVQRVDEPSDENWIVATDAAGVAYGSA